MPEGQDHYKIFQNDENGSTRMVWQLAIPKSDKKPVVYCEKSLEKTGLLYKNTADSVCHTHMVSRRWNKNYLQKVGVINEETGSFNVKGKKVNILTIRGGVVDTRLEAKAKDTKKSEAKAKDSLSEDRPSRGQGEECSRSRTKDTVASVLQKKRSPKKFFRQFPIYRRSQNF